ncbi:hypothetical protein BATDEDRAFT_90813 [Batrachochytrium dendrobatidis JAM81]|uniref:CDP-diacylglycerol--glycerol-3-phosphate 3-phosphatidyltransferase n=2 Tax=Batrachochytrium dendrobatidis TaxID=109871 RepID=F4P9H4_BATDJ|nr:CDP-diacylglycerol--glycerol-3-phosphate 3-phosphatidyltransferase [Batrachochytrium dendrobatidis JAM81]EGF78317.1 hypothetical protein BATDEDRAFT_90813 [Batrachochytrium dendrobatidis JAM81]OAJ44427.1 hypothetical protein BDEG_27655 [Batrachochytrium dendrobatidis JEL423]|eukprot:XP_006681278.1 hypothetical protein BATDEDRAFT_90813 [Batrachochytrium dendrobatidis JAM81]
MVTDIASCLPLFPVSHDFIDIINEPAQFREALKKGIETARSRIVLASLYIGTTETDLIEELRMALQSNSQLRLIVLVDYFRGSRIEGNGKSTVNLLEPLRDLYPNQVQISLYKSPAAKRKWMGIVPQRFNEIFGLQHIKAYVFDDDVLISGANISKDYFTNRQDRYVLFRKAGDMALYFTELIQTLANLSEASLKISESRKEYLDRVHNTLESFSAVWLKKTQIFRNQFNTIFKDNLTDSDGCTFAAPALQLGCVGIRYDQKAMLCALSLAREAPDYHISIASGYLNFPSVYRDVLYQSKSDIEVLCSSPQANGFFNSRGISKFVPAAYSYLEWLFGQEFSKRNKWALVRIFEFYRADWTWHAKGLWMYQHADPQSPYVTTIGSSNMNQRSLELDMEAQVYLFTRNSLVRTRFNQNFAHLQSYTKNVQLETIRNRRVPTLVKFCARMLRTMF